MDIEDEGIAAVRKRSRQRSIQRSLILDEAAGEREEGSVPSFMEPGVVGDANGHLEATLTELSASLTKVQIDISRAVNELQQQKPMLEVPDLSKKSCSQSEVERVSSSGSRRRSRSKDQISQAVCEAEQHYTSATSFDKAGHSASAETLDADWPTSLQIRWNESQDAADVSQKLSFGLARASTRKITSDLEEQSAKLRSSSKRRCVKKLILVHPNSIGHMVYDFLSACILFYDLLSIPCMVAWDVELTGILDTLAWVTAIFWTADIGLTFTTAFYSHGVLVDDLKEIAKHYFRSWFVPDAVVSLCDWVSLVLLSSTSWRMLRFAKLGRLLRMVGMVRMLRIARVLDEIMERHFSEMGAVAMRMSKMLLVTLCFSHVITCAWFFIGRFSSTDTGARWVDTTATVGDVVVVFSEQPMWYQYATSFHWAMSQIALGAIEIPCTNRIERLFTICCLLIGLLFGSTLVSTLSAAMMEAQMDKRENYLKVQQMRRYLRENRVNRKVVVQVERQLAERLAMKEKLKEDQVVGLPLLSSVLRAELRVDILGPFLKHHPLFRLWANMDDTFVVHFCRRCMELIFLRTQDELFIAGNPAHFVYFLSEGLFEYIQEPESSPLEDTSTRIVQKGSWLAEVALWSHWVHVGTAHASQYSEAAQVTVEAVMETMQLMTPILQLTRDYCKNFHRRLLAAKPPASSWPDDLQVPLTEWGDMVLAMQQESQMIIGLDAIEQAAKGHRWNKAATGSQFDKLGKEVRTGKSTVMLNASGDIERVVSVVALKICNSHGKVLTQLGKADSGNIAIGCQLPGGKQERGELTSDSVERLLETKLNPIAEHVEITHVEREIQWKESKEYGIRTKYLRNIIHSRLENEDSLIRLKLPAVAVEWPDKPPFDPPADIPKRSRRGSMTSVDRAVLNGAMAEARMGGELQETLAQRSAFIVQDDKGKVAVYAWLEEEEFEQLKGPVGERLLPAWLSALMAAQAEEERVADCADVSEVALSARPEGECTISGAEVSDTDACKMMCPGPQADEPRADHGHRGGLCSSAAEGGPFPGQSACTGSQETTIERRVALV